MANFIVSTLENFKTIKECLGLPKWFSGLKALATETW